MARAKLNTITKNALNNFYKLIGVNLGNVIKEALQGASSSYTRVSFIDDFLGDSISPIWGAPAIVGTTPTVVVASTKHAVTLTLAATSEVESAVFSGTDFLNYPIAKKPYFEVYAKYSRGATAAASYARIGLASAVSTNTTEALLGDVVTNLWFKINDTGAALTVTVESDDGTTDTDAKALVGITPVSGTFYKYAIDASNLNAVKFYMNDILVATTSMAAATTATLQPVFVLGKVANASVPTLEIDYVKVETDR